MHIIWKKRAWLKVRKFDPAARNGKCPLYLTRINLKRPRRPFSLPPSIFDSCLFLLAREGIITAVATCELEVNYGSLAPREPRTLTVTNEYADDPVRRSHCSYRSWPFCCPKDLRRRRILRHFPYPRKQSAVMAPFHASCHGRNRLGTSRK